MVLFHLKHKPLLWIICVLSNSFSEEMWEQYYTLSSLLKSNILKPWLRFAVLEQMQVWEVGRCCQVVPEPTHSCHVAGLCLHRPTLSVSVSELMLISLCSKFLNCSCFFPYPEVSFPLILKYAWAFYLNFFNSKTVIKLSAWNEIPPLSDVSCRDCMFEDVCVRFFCSNHFYFSSNSRVDIHKTGWPLSRPIIVLSDVIRQENVRGTSRSILVGNHCCWAGFLY